MAKHNLHLPTPKSDKKSNKSNLKAVKPKPIESNLAYHVYCAALAPSGRKSVISLLGRAALIMGYSGHSRSLPWHTIKYRDLQKIRSKMLELEYSVNSINLLLAALKGIAKTAFNLEMMNADTLMRIQSVKSVKGETLRKGRSLSKTEIKKITSACKGRDTRKARDLALIMVGCGAGLRCSEIISLRAEDVDLEYGVIRVLNAKGNKQREVFVSEKVISVIKNWINLSPSNTDIIFKRIYKGGAISNKGLTSNGINQILKGLCERLKLKPISCHDLRRTYVTRLLDQKVDINIVRQLVGHSDLSTTARYDFRNKNALRTAGKGVGV